MAMLEPENSSNCELMQARHHFILTTIWGLSPRRARKTIELPGVAWLAWAHPQCVSRCRLNLRGRNLLQSRSVAVTPTIPSETICCQPTLATYAYSSCSQQIVSSERVLIINSASQPVISARSFPAPRQLPPGCLACGHGRPDLPACAPRDLRRMHRRQPHLLLALP